MSLTKRALAAHLEQHVSSGCDCVWCSQARRDDMLLRAEDADKMGWDLVLREGDEEEEAEDGVE